MGHVWSRITPKCVNFAWCVRIPVIDCVSGKASVRSTGSFLDAVFFCFLVEITLGFPVFYHVQFSCCLSVGYANVIVSFSWLVF
jgi:hypothetical protein